MATVEIYLDHFFGYHQYVRAHSSNSFHANETRYAIQTGHAELGAQIEAGNDALRQDFRNLQTNIAKEKEHKLDAASTIGRRGSRSNATDVNFPLSRYLEELPPEDHPWAQMSEPGDVLSLRSLYDSIPLFDYCENGR